MASLEKKTILLAMTLAKRSPVIFSILPEALADALQAQLARDFQSAFDYDLRPISG